MTIDAAPLASAPAHLQAAGPGVVRNGRHVGPRRVARAEGPATVLAIGTATPPTAFEQSTYPDYFFDITNCSHKTELKEKFERICKLARVPTRAHTSLVVASAGVPACLPVCSACCS